MSVRPAGAGLAQPRGAQSGASLNTPLYAASHTATTAGWVSRRSAGMAKKRSHIIAGPGDRVSVHIETTLD